eukprot:EC793092.1.p2 GENE.EC793092.1~~EC793092.1.p2  ORF type:complete len:161 (+),score=76.01 EC793092.1:81-563(+)
MKVFKDIMSGDEMLSDSYGEEVDGPFVEAEGAYMMKDTGVAGFECGEEGVEDGVVRVIDIVDAFKLQEVAFDKKQYQAHMKGYLQAMKAELEADGKPEAADELVAQAKSVIAGVLGKADELSFYMGENLQENSMVVLVEWDAEGIPTFMYWRHGLMEEKY